MTGNNTLRHQWTDHSDEKIDEAAEILNNTIDQVNLIDIYRTLYLKKKKKKLEN